MSGLCYSFWLDCRDWLRWNGGSSCREVTYRSFISSLDIHAAYYSVTWEGRLKRIVAGGPELPRIPIDVH